MAVEYNNRQFQYPVIILSTLMHYEEVGADTIEEEQCDEY